MSGAEYRHSFRGPLQGYAVNFLKANLWKLQPLYTMEDASQEAWLVFDRVARAYPTVEDRHLMSLYKQALTRHVIDLAKKATRAREEGGQVDADAPGDLAPSGYLYVLLRQMPGELQTVVRLFLQAPEELVRTLINTRRRTRARDASNAEVVRLLGMTADRRPIDEVEDYLIK